MHKWVDTIFNNKYNHDSIVHSCFCFHFHICIINYDACGFTWWFARVFLLVSFGKVYAEVVRGGLLWKFMRGHSDWSPRDYLPQVPDFRTWTKKITFEPLPFSLSIGSQQKTWDPAGSPSLNKELNLNFEILSHSWFSF